MNSLLIGYGVYVGVVFLPDLTSTQVIVGAAPLFPKVMLDKYDPDGQA